MDLEGFTNQLLNSKVSEKRIHHLLAERIRQIKNCDDKYANEFARAVVEEVENTRRATGDIFSYERSGVTMGEFGVGSRGRGDFYAHRKIAEVIGSTSAEVGVDQMDDAGVVRARGEYIVCTVDGMHSRLSDFPFLAGFHATRATLRDVYVMGAWPIMLFSDIHVADDGDVAKIFDYTAGTSCVGDAMGVPLVAGSTLRIGGDMVLGDRMTGCVGAVGISEHLTPRRDVVPGDVLLMTEGAGGGTIATTAIYSGFPHVVDQTLNLHFLRACEALLRSPIFTSIHAMADITNGGLRGDTHEMAETAHCRIVVEDVHLRELVQPQVLALLDRLEIDYLGVSLDALLIAAPFEIAPAIIKVVNQAGVKMQQIGRVERGRAEAALVVDGKEQDFSPRFRESAYTPLKKVVDRKIGDFDAMKKEVDRAAQAALGKKNLILQQIMKR